MEPKELIIDGLGRVQQILTKALDALTPEKLAYRPSEQSNSIAWLAWHLTRVQDTHYARLRAQEQVWIAGGWAAKLGREADPAETGHGHTPQDVATIRPDGQILLGYHDAVYQRSIEYLSTLSASDFDRVLEA